MLLLRAFGLALLVVLSGWAPASAVKIERVRSPGGIEAWLVRDKIVPMVAIEFSFRGGSALDPVGKEGLAQLTADLMNESGGNLDSQAFQAELEHRAISLSFSAGLDTVSGSLKTLNAHRDVAVDLARLALASPRFDTADLERARSRMIANIARTAEDPNTIVRQVWMQTAFPDHPYGRNLRGTAQTISAITADDMRDFVRRRLARDNLIVGVTGDIAPAELEALLDKLFGHLPAISVNGTVADVSPQGLGRTIVVRRRIPQSVVLFGEGGVKRDDPDYYAALVMNYILGGGGFNSRLMTEVREKRGLVYSVYSSLAPYDRTGLIMGGAGTENARVAQTLEVVRGEWQRMRDEGPTAEELADAKTYLNGSFPLQLTSASAIARTLVSIQYDSLGIDYLEQRASLINSVTLEQVRAVARRLLDPGRLLQVIVGEPDGIASADPPARGG